ncbi:MAG: tripartite tricarboxylate transporter substrate-binding protein [Kiloniellales bacterium]|nr:tripartite tricarboxylate transporter substrate-binding protein [Kiloniellales bacterium]
MRRRTVLTLATAAAMALALPGTASAEVDFSGKRIEWIIPFKEGGGSDTWARFYAPLLAANLPGEPTLVVKNIKGGGSTIGANQFASRAKPDGLTVLGTSGSTQFPYLLNDPRVEYEYKDWRLVMATPTGGVFYVSTELGIESAADLAKLAGRDDLKFGSQGATSLDLIPLLALEMLEIRPKAIFGMKGSGGRRLAFERGETNLDHQTSAAFIKKVKPLADAGKAVALMTWGAVDTKGEIVRDPTFPDLPSFKEVYTQIKGEAPSGPAWEAWKSFMIAGYAAQKMIFLPKDTPDEVLAAWRDAAEKTISAPDFHEKSAKVLGLYPQKAGEAAQPLFEIALNVDPKAKRWVIDWLNATYDAGLKQD